MSQALTRLLNKTSEKIKHSDYLYLASRLLLGGVFLYASLDKITHPQDFAAAVENYRLLPPALVAITAAALPWLEALTGLFLMLGLFTRAGAVIITVLLVVFIGALTSAVFRGLNINCGCFDLKYKPSTSGEMINYILRDVMLVFFALQIIISSSRKFSLTNYLSRKLKAMAE